MGFEEWRGFWLLDVGNELKISSTVPLSLAVGKVFGGTHMHTHLCVCVYTSISIHIYPYLCLNSIYIYICLYLYI